MPSLHPKCAKSLAALIAALFIALGLPLAGAQTAHAVSSPVTATPSPTPSAMTALEVVDAYWSYWTAGSTGEWVYQSNGAGALTPADGTSQGWRYGIGASPAYTEKPRVAPDFAQVCGSTPVAAGEKRIAIVIDSGTPAEAPAGSSPPGVSAKCVSVPTPANGLQALSAASSLRQAPDAMVCGINGYPATGCGEQVTLMNITASPMANAALAGDSAPNSTSNSSANWIPFAIGGFIVVLLIIVAVTLSRRRST